MSKIKGLDDGESLYWDRKSHFVAVFSFFWGSYVPLLVTRGREPGRGAPGMERHIIILCFVTASLCDSVTLKFLQPLFLCLLLSLSLPLSGEILFCREARYK